MFCPECGTKNKRGSEFCGNCGFDLSSLAKKKTAAPVKKKGGYGWIIALFLFAVLAICAFLFIHANFELDIPFADELHLDFLEIDLSRIDLPDWLPFSDAVEGKQDKSDSIRDSRKSQSDEDESEAEEETAEEVVEEEAPAVEEAVEEVVPKNEKIVFIANGTLGDKSFIDSADSGLRMAAADFGYEYEIVEAGNDFYEEQAAILDAAENPDVDYIVSSWGINDLLPDVALSHPEKHFIVYDMGIDFASVCTGCDNVYSMEYKQNESTFLAGYYAGLMSETGRIGAVGGMDISIINDYITGFKQGAVYAGISEDDVLIAYADTFSDIEMGIMIAESMYAQGADILFHVAGLSGEGIFYAAEASGNWAIGIGVDQALAMEEINPEQAAFILTSVVMHVDTTLYRAFELIDKGRLEWGANERLGIAEGAVGLAMNKYYKEYTPFDIQRLVLEMEDRISAGEFIIDSVF